MPAKFATGAVLIPLSFMPATQRKLFWIYLQSVGYILAGVNHFLHPGPYVQIVPPPLPADAAVYISGIFEIILGVLLLFAAARRIAGWGIIILLILIFPANLYMAVEYIRLNHPHACIAVLRLPLQGVLIWLARWSTK